MLPTGDRLPASNSRGSHRSWAPCPEFNRVITAESLIERDVRDCLRARRDLVGLRDQWPTVWYRDADGRERRHVFDYCALYASGLAEAIAVKPEDRVDHEPKDGRPSLAETVRFVNAQGVLGRFAHRAVILTRRDVPQGHADNARSLLRARLYRNEADVREALDAVSRLGDRFLFDRLLRDAKQEWRRRNAVWNLIDDGVLAPEKRGAVLDRSWLRAVSAKKEAA